MTTQAILNTRTVDDAYRVFFSKDPATGMSLNSIDLNSLAAALHYVEVSVIAGKRFYDPTVPNADASSQHGGELARLSSNEATFELTPLKVDNAQSLESSCIDAIAESRHLIESLTLETVRTERYHSPLPPKDWEHTVGCWRRHLADTSDPTEVRARLANDIFTRKKTFRGSKCVLGLLCGPHADVANIVRNLFSQSDDDFVGKHLIPVLIDRFRLQFLPALGTQQEGITVALSDPRLAGLAEDHSKYVVRYVMKSVGSDNADGTVSECITAFKYLFDTVPLGLLALLSVTSAAKKPDSRRVFDKVCELKSQFEGIIDPSGVKPGQFMNELAAGQREELESWIMTLNFDESFEDPWYCTTLKYATPFLFAVGGAFAGAVSGPVGIGAGVLLAGAGGLPAGGYLAELANPNREYKIAVRNYQNIKGLYSKSIGAQKFGDLVRARVKSVFGLTLT